MRLDSGLLTAEDARARREMTIKQAQLVADLLPQLTSDDEHVKELALFTVYELGDEYLAQHIAGRIGGEGAVAMLSQVAADPSSTIQAAASRTLEMLLAEMRQTVVQVLHGDDGFVASGYVASSEGHIVTTDYAVQERGPEIKIRSAWGTVYSGMLLFAKPEAGLAIIKLHQEGLRFLQLVDGEPPQGSEILVLGYTRDRGSQIYYGHLGGPVAGDNLVSGGRVSKFLRAELESEPGFAGAPVVTPAGQLAGITYSAIDKEQFLVPSYQINSALKALGVNCRAEPHG